ncbi:non-specific lipid transfer protein GPI-anchored 14-like [Salvia miltiorrhiza]|uniref:non-specific lipid transfer protein GPI-anchored 14-like n=1 Tax=Salvia miltiorrhiza TaxID=226208 RepID=UPI0025ABD3BC|nr:non-specific lipid transfer protein GPI-anchored 14-like [Salvia miltiorrhiza]
MEVVLLSRVMLVLLLSVVGRCDVDKDKEKCANDLVGLATCLPYVSGEAKSPPVDCCTGLKQVLQKSPQCICLLVKDRNDPSLGLKINATLALSLPSHCHSPANITDCPALLHLPPNSPDAKVFEDFANTAHKSNATALAAAANSSSGKTTTAAATTGDVKSGGGKKKSYWLGLLFTMMVAFTICQTFEFSSMYFRLY